MTPSSATGRATYSQTLHLSPFPLTFPSPQYLCTITIFTPTLTPPPEFLDIIEALLARNMIHLLDTIFGYLTQQDLQSCFTVSRQWSKYISTTPTLHSRLHAPPSTTDISISSIVLVRPFPRDPLTSITNREQHERKLMRRPPRGRGGQGSGEKRRGESHSSLAHYRQCPRCMSRARVLHHRRSVCMSERCQLDFCVDCFSSWHEDKCWEEKEESENIEVLLAGTQQSRKRLRRLWTTNHVHWFPLSPPNSVCFYVCIDCLFVDFCLFIVC